MSSIDDLLKKRPRTHRHWTLSVDQDTYDLVKQVSSETGKSCPRVIAAFVEAGYEEYNKVKAQQE